MALDYTPSEEEQALAGYVARFLAKAYGSEEDAAAAILKDLEAGDLSLIRAGVDHAREVRKRMTENVLTRTDEASRIVLDLIFD